jgi:hypothetical protein
MRRHLKLTFRKPSLPQHFTFMDSRFDIVCTKTKVSALADAPVSARPPLVQRILPACTSQTVTTPSWQPSATDLPFGLMHTRLIPDLEAQEPFKLQACARLGDASHSMSEIAARHIFRGSHHLNLALLVRVRLFFVRGDQPSELVSGR